MSILNNQTFSTQVDFKDQTVLKYKKNNKFFTMLKIAYALFNVNSQYHKAVK